MIARYLRALRYYFTRRYSWAMALALAEADLTLERAWNRARKAPR